MHRLARQHIQPWTQETSWLREQAVDQNVMAASSQPMFDFNAGSRPLFAQQVLSLKDVALYDHFWTSSRWSPDGLALAAVDNKRHVHTWLLPQDSFLRNSEAFTKAPSALSAAGAAADSDSDSALAELPSAVSSLSEAEFVDAHAWHPSSCVSNPSWCVFATSSKSQPVHLWDALTGKVRFAAPLSCCCRQRAPPRPMCSYEHHLQCASKKNSLWALLLSHLTTAGRGYMQHERVS